MAFPLTSLPNELQQLVLEFLADDKYTFDNIFYVSRKFKAFAENIRYRCIELEEQTPLGRTGIKNFLRTLINRPDLMSKTRSLKYKAIGNDQNYMDAEEETDIDDYRGNRELAQWSDWIQESIGTFKSLSKYMQDIKMDYSEDQFPGGVIISCLKNITELDARVWRHDCYIAAAADPLFQLFRLRPGTHPIQLAKPIDDNTLYHQSLAPVKSTFRTLKKLVTRGIHLSILDLPFERLETLDVDLIGAENFTGGNSDQYSFHSYYSQGNMISDQPLYFSYDPLSHLIVRSDWAELQCEYASSPSCVFQLLETLGCVNLTTFEFHLHSSPRHEWPESPHIGTYNHIAKCLPGLSNIENLRIDCGAWFQGEFLPRFRPIKTLQHFSHLKNLEILQHAIVGRSYGWADMDANIVNLLPISLESITIICPDAKILWWLEDLLKCHKALPHLRWVTLLCKYPSAQFCANHYIFRELGKAGIQVKAKEDLGVRATVWPGRFGQEERDSWSLRWSPDEWLNGQPKGYVDETNIWLQTWLDESWLESLFREE